MQQQEKIKNVLAYCDEVGVVAKRQERCLTDCDQQASYSVVFKICNKGREENSGQWLQIRIHGNDTLGYIFPSHGSQSDSPRSEGSLLFFVRDDYLESSEQFAQCLKEIADYLDARSGDIRPDNMMVHMHNVTNGIIAEHFPNEPTPGGNEEKPLPEARFMPHLTC